VDYFGRCSLLSMSMTTVGCDIKDTQSDGQNGNAQAQVMEFFLEAGKMTVYLCPLCKSSINRGQRLCGHCFAKAGYKVACVICLKSHDNNAPRCQDCANPKPAKGRRERKKGLGGMRIDRAKPKGAPRGQDAGEEVYCRVPACGKPIRGKVHASGICWHCFASREENAHIVARVKARQELERQRRAEAALAARLSILEREQAHKARVEFLSGKCWTREGMRLDGRTPMQCCYADCRASHAGNGFCRSHQPPADRLKGAVEAAKAVIRERAGLPVDQAG